MGCQDKPSYQLFQSVARGAQGLPVKAKAILSDLCVSLCVLCVKYPIQVIQTEILTQPLSYHLSIQHLLPKLSTMNQKILDFFSGIETAFDKTSFLVKKKMGWLGPFAILPYHGMGNHERVHITGRLLEEAALSAPEEDDSAWVNLYSMASRYESNEIPYTRIKITFLGQEKIVKTDSEGFFSVNFSVTKALPNQVWHQAQFELVDQLTDDQEAIKAVGEIMIPSKTAQFGVISDVDDTILISRSNDLSRKAKLTFLHNAKTRMPFEGVAAFYQALQEGYDDQCHDGGRHNPIFYVSSSPWNLYDLLTHFCEVNDIPKGPFLLRDMGLDEDKFIKSGHMDHKMEQVEQIFQMYPDLPFILIGDSGQKDAEIYEKVAQHYPDQVAAIYIRDVTPEARDQEVRRIAERLREQGIAMHLCQTTQEAACHAAEKGFIRSKALKAVGKAQREDKEWEAQ